MTFLSIWNRSTDPNQRCRILLTFNPPVTVEGRWVIAFFAPWLDPKHPNPAVPGELRYYATIEGEEIEVPNGDPIWDESIDEWVTPQSRTFIPASLSDNPHLRKTKYRSVLQSLPEPLRSMMLLGDFSAGIEDDQWQVIPTAWVEQAIERWKAATPPDRALGAMGVDPARGGRDETVITKRYGDWIAPQLAYPGTSTPDGSHVAARVIENLESDATVFVDVIGIGSSPYDCLIVLDVDAVGINVGMGSEKTDRSKKLGFKNLRAELTWKLREALDPAYNPTLMIPDDPQLLADLTCYRWKLSGSSIQIESKEETKKRIGRSPDRGDSLILSLVNYTPDTRDEYSSAFSTK